MDTSPLVCGVPNTVKVSKPKLAVPGVDWSALRSAGSFFYSHLMKKWLASFTLRGARVFLFDVQSGMSNLNNPRSRLCSLQSSWNHSSTRGLLAPLWGS